MDSLIDMQTKDSKGLLNEFITFAKTEYGLTVEAVRSDSPDLFEKIFEVTNYDW